MDAIDTEGKTVSNRLNRDKRLPVSTLSKLEELVTCAVCYKLLDNPKVFPCLHSYCYNCIVRLAKRKPGLVCPECCVPVEIGYPPDLSKLPTNFFANNVLATLSLEENSEAPDLICDNCELSEHPVEKRCQDCTRFLCADCAEFHQRSCDTRSHVLLSKDKLKDNKPAENARALRCSVHRNELMKFYCHTCKVAICINCTVLEHKEHKIKSVEESAGKAKDEVKKLVWKVEERMETISAGIRRAVEKKQDIEDRENACNVQIEAYFAQLHKEIEAQKLNLMLISASAADNQKKQVEASKKQLDLALSTCQNGVNFATHTLENSSDVQLLGIKQNITLHLSNLTGIQDEVALNVGNSVCLLKQETPISLLCEQLITNVCSVEEVKLCAERCEAKLTDPLLKVGKKSVIIITSKDNDGRIISSSCGDDLIEPNFSGVSLQNVQNTGNSDGTHQISFVVKELGTLHFGAKINGCLAPGCSVNADVNWEMDYKHGCGYLRMSNGQIFNCMSGEGDVGRFCFRLGDTPMTAGVHHWKVEVGHEVQDVAECFQEGPTIEVGVIEKDEDYSETRVTNGTIKKWIYSGPGKSIANVFLNLDMGRKCLEVLPRGRFSLSKAFSHRRKTFNVNANSVLPFFSVNCPHCSLTFFMKNR
ncbi:tripartite motif-containing protein 45-like isoform X2 [Dendronephthya gigantea]|uniref:tripartite motif-containing protein 45-like isoform X2 n=1 Tax=Dendronephthya gigantea TaxID=151771 RepID=UPI001069BD75|nr:tripartite motif-containing protein 45-like isoform X2 [Dendronephthya gigantea]